MGNVFCLGLFGHNKTGKTTLGEAILFKTKATDRMGDVNQGTALLDYDEEAVRRGMSVNMTPAFVEWDKKRIYLIDTPGYMDFLGEQLSGLEAADCALMNISADGGIEIGTEKTWELVGKKKMPAAVFINKLDLPEIQFSKIWNDLEAFFGAKLILITCPEYENGKLTRIANLLDAGDAEKEPYRGYVQKAMDTLAELDDALMEKYLESGVLSPEEISSLLKKGIVRGAVLPVLSGAAASQTGVEELLNFIVRYMPSSEELPPAAGKTPDGQEATRERKPEAPLSGIITKTISDPFIGRLSYLKVISGKLTANSSVFNATKNTKERIGQLLRMQGKKQEPVNEVMPGEIVAVAKLAESGTYDTFCDAGAPIVYPAPNIPEGAVSYSITPKVKGTEDKLGNAIGRITEEDFTIKVFRDNETGQTILSGMGDVHLDVAVSKFKNKYGVEVEKGVPKIAYKETITATANAEGKHKKQSGGRGQFGHCYIKVEPLPRGGGFEFVDEIFGGAIPRNFIPSVEKGVREALGHGELAGYPIVDLKVTLTDGSYHTVDSSDIAFQLAGILALHKGVAEARPILLEPIVNIEVRIPQEFVGEIIGSINAKRGRVLDMAVVGASQVIKAQVPLAEMSTYTSEIRSITSGKGAYSMMFSHYEVVPSHIAEKIIGERKKEKEAKA